MSDSRSRKAKSIRAPATSRRTFQRVFEDVGTMKTYLDSTTEDVLIELGYTSNEVAVLKTAFADLAELATIWIGSAALAARERLPAVRAAVVGRGRVLKESRPHGHHEHRDHDQHDNQGDQDRRDDPRRAGRRGGEGGHRLVTVFTDRGRAPNPLGAVRTPAPRLVAGADPGHHEQQPREHGPEQHAGDRPADQREPFALRRRVADQAAESPQQHE